MVNLILITFTGLVAYTGFCVGAKYKTITALWADAKAKIKSWVS